LIFIDCSYKFSLANFIALPVFNQAPRHEGVLESGGLAPRIL